MTENLNPCVMPSISPIASLRSSESSLSSCSDFSIDANSDGRIYLEECGTDSSQENSTHGLKQHSNDLSSPVNVNRVQRPSTSAKGDLQGSIVHDTWATRDAENVGTIHDAEEGHHSLERVISSIVDETENSPCHGEMDDQYWLPPDPEDNVDNTEGSVIDYDDDDDECGDGISWGMPSSLSSFGEERSGTHKFKEEKQKAMEEVMNGKFKALVGQLLKSVGVVSSGKDGNSWVDIVTLLSWEAAMFVKPDAAEGKAMDPDGYVKIKCIASGFPRQSQVIRGLVFKKHAAHKHMPTKYKNPRLMLIQGALGLSSNGLSSFESMQQEKDSMKAIIDVIDMYQPNVVLVEKTVSRDIQESILAKGMTLVLDMKLHRLERVARCTGSPILSSDALVGQKLRQCDSFHFEKFVEEHATYGESGKKPSKTLMFLEGSPTRLGCTIFLMGADSDQLKRIKCVVRCAVVMAYHFILETYFLLDQRAMFSTIPFSEVMNFANQVLSPGNASDPISWNGESMGESGASCTIDIPISNGFHEEGTEYLNSAAEANSSLSFESYNPVILSGLSSLSASLKKAMGDNFPLFSTSRQAMSTYFGFDEGKPDDRGESSVDVPISPKAVDYCDAEIKVIGDEEKEYDHVQPHSPSTLSEAPLQTQMSSGDYEEHIPNKDDIKAILDSESILVLMSSRNASRGTMCEHSHFSHIKFYRNFDVPLGKFLHDNLLNQRVQCKTCGELPEAHFYYYAHHSKQLIIQVRRLPTDNVLPGESDGKLWMWSRCGKCVSHDESSKSKRVLISTAARGLSFGKFLELSFSNPSSFRRKSSCGHSLHRDYLFFFGLGPMVSMFKYSKVATYLVSLTPQKLEFGNSIKGGLLNKEFETVYKKGIEMFLEIEKFLKEVRSRYVGMSLNLQGSIKDFSDIEEMLKEERAQFEVDIQNAVKNVNGHEAIYKFLRLNKVRLVLLLESCIWDRRLNYLLSSDLSVVCSRTMDRGVPQQTCMETTQVEDGGLDISVEESENVLDGIPIQEINLVKAEEGNNFQKVSTDGQDQVSRKQDGSSSSASITEVGTSGNGTLSYDSSNMADVFVHSRADGDGLQDNLAKFVPLQADKIVPITTDVEGSLLDSNNYQSGKSLFRFSFNVENDKGWIWIPFTEIQRDYMNDLWRGYLPKFDSATGLPLDTTSYKLIIDEASKLHIPLGTDDYVVSDYEDEFSSIIACGLTLLKDLPMATQILDEDPRKEKGIMMSNDNSQSFARIFSLTSPHWSSSGYLDSDGIYSSPSISSEESLFSSFDSLDLLDPVVSLGAVHQEVSMGIGKVPGKRKYSVVCLYSSQFRNLRNRCCPSEVDYIASLSRCRNWDAKGGKSKSFFAKTLDDRFIIKEIKRTEFEAFMKFAPNYFDYMNQCYENGNQTCLAKILGIYQIIIRQTKSGKETRHDLMVMENLSFDRSIVRQYDLKGALHSRFNSTTNGAGDVLLDQNFVNDMNVSPLYVSRKSKRILQRAVWNDTTFLNSINVMDYSLLVGVDAEKRELVCGIIDYLRQYTWDKQLENWVKSSLVVPKNQLPTIISPREYKKRFRKFIDTYFLSVPDHWCSQRSLNPCKLCGMGDDDDCLYSSQELRVNNDDSFYHSKSVEQGEHSDPSYVKSQEEGKPNGQWF
ncbi:hypothetical protein ACH5RR_033880 [Cinchona calisaya]|uniref:1-phosphatidylinositol-3-phosphate 5-kinase n=1 Tax=Cinchona calisaya TaxID=153742 RepID=A0ABD2YD28_9GENT